MDLTGIFHLMEFAGSYTLLHLSFQIVISMKHFVILLTHYPRNFWRVISGKSNRNSGTSPCPQGLSRNKTHIFPLLGVSAQSEEVGASYYNLRG